MIAQPAALPLARVGVRAPVATAVRDAEDAAESTSAEPNRRKPESALKPSLINPSIRLGNGLRRHGRRWMMDGTPPRHVAPQAASAISNEGAQARGYRAVAWPRLWRDAASTLGIDERLLFPARAVSAHPPRASSSPLPFVLQRGHDAGREGPPATMRVPHAATWVADAHHPDPLLLAFARYVQALHQRYPDGPDQLRDTSRANRANMPTVLHPKSPAK